MNDAQLIDLLTNYGLSTHQAKLYLTCVQLGTAPAASIARRAGVNRTSCYASLQELHKRGLVFTIERNHSKHYYALDPESLADKLKERYHEFVSHLPAFAALQLSIDYKPAIKFYDGQERVRDMLFSETKKRQISMQDYDQTWWGFQDHSFVEHYIDHLDRARTFITESEYVKLLSNRSTIEQEIHKEQRFPDRRVIKFDHPFQHFDSTIWILGDYVVIIVITGHHHYAYELHDPRFAANQRDLFQFVWKHTN